MMSYHPRRILTPGASRKRKERESFHGTTSLKPLVQATGVGETSLPTTSSKGAEQQPLSSNRLLAGYMAFEFLTKGTLFGEKFDPARAEAIPVNTADSKRNKQIQNRGQPNVEAEPSGKMKPHSYAEVANLLKSDGTHIPGVVNPTQLARWIQM